MNIQNTIIYIPPTKFVNDPLWVNDFTILLKKEKLAQFFPTKFQTNEERLNSIVRLGLYTSLILSIYHSNIKYISIFIFTLVLTYIIYINHPINKTEGLENTSNGGNWNIEKQSFSPPENCTKPTLDNPFMNATMKNYLDIDSDNNIIPPSQACDPNDPDIKREIDSNFNNNLYNDISDMFGKLNSQRNFFTMPWTTIPNDPNLDFAKWLYSSPATCHEDQNSCIRGIHEDIRQNKFIFPEPTMNPVSSKKLE
jgi:hypothetical protein